MAAIGGPDSIGANAGPPVNEAMPPSTSTTLHLAGDPHCTVGGTRHALQVKDAFLLAYLALEGPRARAQLCVLLWPDASPPQARTNLRQRLLRLKRQLGAALIVGNRTLALSDAIDVVVDGGELLGGLDADPDTALGDWLDRTRSRRRDDARNALLSQADAHEAAGRLPEALACVQDLLALDPAAEPVHQRAMRVHYLRGDRAAAAAAYQRCVESLRRELGVSPAPDTQQLWARIGTMASATAPTTSAVPLSVLRPPRLIGRGRELQAAQLAWGGARGFVLRGEAGMGKSRLLAELAQMQPSVLVQARPGDAGVPYALLATLLRALIQRQPAVLDQAPRAEIARVLPELGPAPGLLPEGQRLWLQGAVYAVLRCARDGGVEAILVDDLHFADPASVEMLQSMADTGTDDPIALRWGFALRPGEADPAAMPLRLLEEQGRLEPIVLTPLDESRLAELLDSLELPGLDLPLLARQIARHTGGNPLYALETLRHLLAQGGGGAGRGLPRPSSVGTMIERRLRQLSPRAASLARIAALAGVDFSIELAEQVLGTRALDLSDAWTELESAQVLRGASFANDLVFETALAGVPAAIAAHTHGAIAAFLETRQAPPARQAQHWIAAGQPRRALGALHAAAEAARLAMRPREQAQFLLRAADIEHDADGAAEFESLRDAASALFMADRTLLDDGLLTRLERAARGPAQQATALRLRAELLQSRGEFDAVVRVAGQAMALARAAGDEALICEIVQMEGAALSMRGEFERAARAFQTAAPWIERHGRESSRLSFHGDYAVVLDNVDRHDEAQAHHRRALELALVSNEQANAVIVLCNLGVSYSSIGDLTQATEVLLRAERLMAAHDEARGAGGVVPALLSRCLRDQAHYADALRWAEIGLREMQAQAPAWVAAMHVHIATTYTHLGQHARARQELKLAQAAADPPAWIEAARHLADARLQRALGQDARAAVADARATAPAHGRRSLRDLIELEHALGLRTRDGLDIARDVAAQAERRQHLGVVLAAHIRGAQFATALGRADWAMAHAEAALALAHERSPEDLYRAELWLHAAAACDCAKLPVRARALREEGAQWIRTTAEQQVPPAFVDSFLNRNPVNRTLLAAAANAAR